MESFTGGDLIVAALNLRKPIDTRFTHRSEVLLETLWSSLHPTYIAKTDSCGRLYLRYSTGPSMRWMPSLHPWGPLRMAGVPAASTWTPQVCTIIAFWATFSDFGQLFYIRQGVQTGTHWMAAESRFGDIMRDFLYLDILHKSQEESCYGTCMDGPPPQTRPMARMGPRSVGRYLPNLLGI